MGYCGNNVDISYCGPIYVRNGPKRQQIRNRLRSNRSFHSVGQTLRSSARTRFHQWEGSIRFPQRAGCCFRGRQVLPRKSEATRKRPLLWYQDQAGRAPLRSWRCCMWARRRLAPPHNHLPSEIFWRASAKLMQILDREISSIFVPRNFAVLHTISRSDTWPQGLPHRVHWIAQVKDPNHLNKLNWRHRKDEFWNTKYAVSFCTWWIWLHTGMTVRATALAVGPCHVFVFLFCCYAATQLALQLCQERSQVVYSNKEARKRLSKSNGTPAMDP